MAIANIKTKIKYQVGERKLRLSKMDYLLIAKIVSKGITMDYRLERLTKFLELD